jgi:cytochrome c oxidase cbb3-type subunit 2
MNRVSVILFGSIGVLLLTSVFFVVSPYVFFKAVPAEGSLRPYTADQAAGRKVYISLGCLYCHSQQPRDPAFAPDGARGWGRPSTPGDYAYDTPHLLGTMRTGPDLFNVGARLPSAEWHLVHLFNPRAVVPESIMPAYPFLFEVKAAAGPKDVIVPLPAPFAPSAGVVVARPDARALVAYLLGLDHTYASDRIGPPPVAGVAP